MSNESNEQDSSSLDSDKEDFNEDEYIPDICELSLSSKEKLYFKMVNRYFKAMDPLKIQIMLDIIAGKSYISLRLLDWFITRYANKHKIRFNDDTSVHISYKAQLKSYKKRYFDPFRRRKKFVYYFDNDRTVHLCTTIGQLNFFRWADTINLIKEVDSDFDNISKAMNISNKLDKQKKRDKKRQKDSKSRSNTNSQCSTDKRSRKSDKIVLSFD